MIAALAGVGQLTRYLPPEEYGRFALGVTAATLPGLWLGAIAAATTRFTPAAIEERQSRVLIAALRHTLTRRMAALVAIGAAASLVTAFVSLAIGALVLATTGYAMATGLALNAEAILNARRLRPQLAVHKALQQILNYAAALALLQITPCAALVMSGFFLGTLLTALSEARVARNALPWQAEAAPEATAVGHFVDRLRTYARPYERWGIPAWLHNASDRWALTLFASTYDTGLYSVAYQLGFSPIMLSGTLVAQVAEPIAYARAGDGSDPQRVQHAQRVRRWTTVLFVGACAAAIVGAWALRDVVFQAVIDPAYHAAAAWLPWLVLAGMVSSLGNIESMRWLIRAEPARMESVRIWTAFIGCALIATGAALAGARGVIAGQIAGALLFLVWVRRLR